MSPATRLAWRRRLLVAGGALVLFGVAALVVDMGARGDWSWPKLAWLVFVTVVTLLVVISGLRRTERPDKAPGRPPR